jgi:hypothetical protein
VCLYVCDQETLKREAKGPSWTISACGKDTLQKQLGLTLANLFHTIYIDATHLYVYFVKPCEPKHTQQGDFSV